MADPKDNDIIPLPSPEEVKGTLIVAPLSLISNWTSQIEAHLEPSTLKVFVFHGPSKSDPNLNLDDYDVVVTSYQTLMSEYRTSGLDYKNHPTKKIQKTKRGLYGRIWRRIVLDEAHQIRNPEAKVTHATSSLDAVTRWSLSGTPIINDMKDLFSQVRFLRLTGGLSDAGIFNRLITRPLKIGAPSAVTLLQSLMSGLCLRRRKDMKFQGKALVNLPGMDEYVHMIGIVFLSPADIDFTPEEREKYNLLQRQASGMLARINRGDNKSHTFILEILLRMRQFSVLLLTFHAYF